MATVTLNPKIDERERACWLRESFHAAAVHLDRYEGVELSDEWWDEQMAVANGRANAGELPT